MTFGQKSFIVSVNWTQNVVPADFEKNRPIFSTEISDGAKKSIFLDFLTCPPPLYFFEKLKKKFFSAFFIQTIYKCFRVGDYFVLMSFSLGQIWRKSQNFAVKNVVFQENQEFCFFFEQNYYLNQNKSCKFQNCFI